MVGFGDLGGDIYSKSTYRVRDGGELPEDNTITDVEFDEAPELSNSVEIEFDDGSVEIRFGDVVNTKKISDGKHDENLAEILSDADLATLSSKILELVAADNDSRSEWLEAYAAGLDLLGLKVKPGGGFDNQNMSNVNSPILLQAVLSFQANARGELLPSGGPVKVKNDGRSTLQADDDANALEIDMNYYLTSTASEYYPDTDKLLFTTGYGGAGFKKVYNCPIRNRPVIESVDPKDLIVNNSATSLEGASRITHRISMSPNQIKRMQILGMYRDVELGGAQVDNMNAVDEKEDSIIGIDTTRNEIDEDADREIYECYVDLDLAGFEHEIDGNPTGLGVPYRVTIDTASQEILEIRRWWREDDVKSIPTRREVFVEYIFNPALGFYGIGLLHMLGNSTRAVTAGIRMAMDAGMRGNFPAFLYAKSAGKQMELNFRLQPGTGVPIETNNMPLSQAVMPLPFRDVSGAFVGLLKEISEGAEKLGGVANIAVGEGRQDAPVGTTLALIDQATKVMTAVHKRLHAAQAKEFKLLKELFRENPASFFEGGVKSNVYWDVEKFIRALNNTSLVPSADPNIASQMQRIQKAVAIGQMATQMPGLLDPKMVASRIFTMVGIEDYQSLFATQQEAPQADPAPMIEAQAKVMTAKARADQVKVNAIAAMQKQSESGLDRESKEAIEMAKLARVEAIHPDSVGGVAAIQPVIDAAMAGFASTNLPQGAESEAINPFELKTQSVNQELYDPNTQGIQ